MKIPQNWEFWDSAARWNPKDGWRPPQWSKAPPPDADIDDDDDDDS